MTNQTSLAPTHLQLLTSAHQWLIERVAQVKTDHLHRPTPCDAFDLEALLHHLAASIERFTTAVRGPGPETNPIPIDDAQVAGRFEALRVANLSAWATADMTTTYRIPLGDVPAPVVANVNLAEVVLHGWDVGQATGECADVPGTLADAVLAFGKAFLSDDLRGAAFGSEVPYDGDDASARMIAFYGRRS